MTRRIQASHFMHLGRQVELKLSRSATRMCGRRWASQWGMRAAWWRWSKPRPSRKELAFAGRRRPHQENHQQQAKLASAGLPTHPPSHRLPPLPRQPQRRNQDRMSQCRTCPACDFDRVGSQTERTLNSRCSSMVRTRKSASAMIHYTEFSALWNIRASGPKVARLFESRYCAEHRPSFTCGRKGGGRCAACDLELPRFPKSRLWLLPKTNGLSS